MAKKKSAAKVFPQTIYVVEQTGAIFNDAFLQVITDDKELSELRSGTRVAEYTINGGVLKTVVNVTFEDE